jgi:hypothetical protein
MVAIIIVIVWLTSRFSDILGALIAMGDNPNTPRAHALKRSRQDPSPERLQPDLPQIVVLEGASMTNTRPFNSNECQADAAIIASEFQPPETLPTQTNELGNLSLYGYELSSEAPLWNNMETHGVSGPYAAPPTMNAGEAMAHFPNEYWGSMFPPSGEY